MIRDPSDGSVREPPPKPNLDTGLPTASTKPGRQERLEKSREWLREYMAKKYEASHG